MKVIAVLAAAGAGVALLTFALLGTTSGEKNSAPAFQDPGHSSGVPGLSGNVENPTATPTITPTPPPTATPLPQRPWEELRVWTNGDSLSYYMSLHVINNVIGRGAVATPDVATYELGSRLSYWLNRMPNELATYNPNVVVLFVGGNDASGCGMSQDTWRSQVAQMMDMMQGRDFIWLGQPPFNAALRPDMAGCVPWMNDISRQEADARDWVHYVDVFSFTSDANGNFTDYACDAFGNCGTIRNADDYYGQHFTSFGGGLIAFHVVVTIDAIR